MSELNLIRSKLISPLEPCLVNVCQFTSGHAANVVPGQAIIKGTVRCFDETVRTEIKKQITNICSSICKMKSCVCDLIYDAITPSLVNAEKETKIAVKAISALGYTVMERPAQMISEDFACLSQKVPGCFFDLGAGNPEKGFNASQHAPDFDIDEACLPVGLACMLSIYEHAVQS